jgi:hypothetical protein
MPEVQQYAYTFKELAEALVRQQGIHEGLWGVYVEFGIAAGNIGPTPEDVRPAAIVPILKLGLQRFSEPSTLTVDAAEVNPKSTRRPA